MGQLSEAEGLLQSGALYPRRIGLRRPGGDWIFAGFKHGALSVYFGDAPFFHFDLEGRWQRAYVGSTHFLKGLDASVVAIDRERVGSNMILRRRTLSYAEAGDLDDQVRATALELAAELTSGDLQVVEPPPPALPLSPEDLGAFLERVGSWDAEAWFAHRERYLGTYGPIPFVPPDGQSSAVLQATLGHLGGRAFAGARPAEHYVRSAEEFEEHARTVAGLLGSRLVQCRGLFLAGADALRRPFEDVESDFRTLARVFPLAGERAPRPARLSERPIDEPALDGVQAFLDDFAPPLPDRDAWARLRELSLRRVCLGLESGSSAVRSLYGPTWPDEALAGAFVDLKAAGMPLSVVVPVGAGGLEHRSEHESESILRLSDLPFQAGDLVYLIDAEEIGGAAHGDRLRGLDLTPLDAPARREQLARLRAELSRALAGGRVKVVPYSLEKQPG